MKIATLKKSFLPLVYCALWYQIIWDLVNATSALWRIIVCSTWTDVKKMLPFRLTQIYIYLFTFVSTSWIEHTRRWGVTKKKKQKNFYIKVVWIKHRWILLCWPFERVFQKNFLLHLSPCDISIKWHRITIKYHFLVRY